MLVKLSKIIPSNKTGIRFIKLFELYSKKKKQKLNFCGWSKGSVFKANRNRKFFISIKFKNYVIKTKQNLLRSDHTKILFYKNIGYVKHKKLKRIFKNYGPVPKTVKHFKYLFKFNKII